MKEIRLLKKQEIECRVGTISQKGLSLLLYKNARADMKILDETFGAMNWQRTHRMIGDNLYCTVSVWDSEKSQWISKEDVGTESYTEKDKGRASDSFKRACFSLGVGRELYGSPFIWIPASKCSIQSRGDKYITYDRFTVADITYNGDREITGLVILNQDGKCVYALQDKEKPAEQKTKDWTMGATDLAENQYVQKLQSRMIEIQGELKRTGVSMETVLKRYGAESIENMSDAVYQKAINSLRKTKSKNQAA